MGYFTQYGYRGCVNGVWMLFTSEEEYLDCLLKEVTKGEKHDEKAD